MVEFLQFCVHRFQPVRVCIGMEVDRHLKCDIYPDLFGRLEWHLALVETVAVVEHIAGATVQLLCVRRHIQRDVVCIQLKGDMLFSMFCHCFSTSIALSTWAIRLVMRCRARARSSSSTSFATKACAVWRWL